MEESVHDTSAEFGVRLSEAYRHFCHPDIRDECLRAGEVAGWSVHRTRSQFSGLTSAQKQRNADVEAYKAAESRAVEDITSKLCDGRLVARGFFVGPQGRNPDADRRRIPEDVLKSPKRRIEWQNETISGNELTFVDVRLGPTFEAPVAEGTLIGCSLSECFEKVVTDDWLRREMEEVVFRQFPNWNCDVIHYCPVNGDRWPVRFEDWSDPAFAVARLKSPIMFVETRRPNPPEEVVAIRKRAEDQIRLLIAWFRNGALVAEGTREPPDHQLTRETIVRDWWSRSDAEMDITDSALWKGPSVSDGLVYSNVRILAPDSTDPDSIDDRSDKRPRHAKRKGGRPPTWPRDDAIHEVQRFAKEPGGWNRPLSVFENHLKDWFMENYSDHPSDSTVKRYVRAALANDDDQN